MRLHKIFGPINSRAYAICRANSELNVRPWKSFSEEKKKSDCQTLKQQSFGNDVSKIGGLPSIIKP